MKQTKLRPATREAFRLLMEGSVAMSRIEAAGLRIDEGYLNAAIGRVRYRIADLEKSLKSSREYKVWEKHKGRAMKLNSRSQLGKVVFDLCGHKRNPFIEGNDASAFEHLDCQFVKDYQTIARLKKALVTNLYGIKKETVGGFIHPFFSLGGGQSSGEGSGGAESYRSSSSMINFQNQPIRDKDVGEIVRSCVIPRKGNVLLEPDYGTQEVRVSYCYHLDPKLKYDILTGDMHTDRARDLFLLSEEELGPTNKDPGKMVRYIAKNRFIFAEFYGSYYVQCAYNLWDAVAIFNLKTSKGLSLYEHLKSKGITRLGACDPERDPEEGTFEDHVRRVERKMWKETYTVYDQWKRDWWKQYLRLGGIHTLTGFTLEGVFRRNQILCDPIQGSAFHCLLWSIIEMQKELIRRKMKAKFVCQIHDSGLIDCPVSEVDDVVEMFLRIAIRGVAEHWKWIQIPLSTEIDIAEENWFRKKPMTLKGAI